VLHSEEYFEHNCHIYIQRFYIGGVFMTFYSEKISILTDSCQNVCSFQWRNKTIFAYFFNISSGEMEKKIIVEDSLEEYDVAIGENDYIYLIYQNIDRHLVLVTIFRDYIDIVTLTEEPISNVYDLSILLDREEIHIFYNTLLKEDEKVYRLYHHHYDENTWITNIVEDIKVKQVLNSFCLTLKDYSIFIFYYDCVEEEEEIFLKKYDTVQKKWLEKQKITYGFNSKLYMDILIEKNILHIVYSQNFDGNLSIVYEKYDIVGVEAVLLKKEILSNAENCLYPTIIKYEDKLWVAWIEYDAVLSRFSIDGGENWSSIYLWRKSKSIDIVRYKYGDNSIKENNKKLNYSFGSIYPEISFIGFGPLEDVQEIPIKKKYRKIPRF
jgi:hypothetical protein